MKSQGDSQKQIIPRCKGWLELLHIIVILKQYEWAQPSLIPTICVTSQFRWLVFWWIDEFCLIYGLSLNEEIYTG